MPGLAQEGASIKFTKMVHDFGEIEKGAKVETSFEFVNEGTEPLIIKDVATSCGCTTAKLEKDTIAPGEKGAIPVTFSSDRFSGKITKRVTITSNDAKSPKTVVTIQGNVAVQVEAKPASLFFAKAQVGETSTREIAVSTSRMDKLELSNLKIEPEYLTASLVRVDDKNMKIVVTADGTKFPKGKSRLSGYLTYDTNSKNMGNMRASVTINVEQAIRLNPRSLYFYASKQGKERKLEITLTSTQGVSFKVSNIKSQFEFFTVVIDKDGDKEKTLTVTLSPKATLGKFHSNITMTTDIEGQKELVIPVRGSVIP